MLYSAAVIGWFTPFTASFVISVGKVPRPKGVLPVLLKRKFGWLKALIRSTRKLIRRPSLPANGQPKSFESEKSKNSWRGERMSRERGALPNCPLTGRMKAAGLMKGSQPEGGAELPTGQSRLHSGFLKGTPGTMSGLTTRLKSVPPSLFGSVMNGRNGVPPGIRKTPDTVHLPKSPFTTFGASERNIRPRPSGMSQMAVEVKLVTLFLALVCPEWV